MFYLPGCLFFADCKEKRREKSPELRFPLPGERSRARPPNEAGAGPTADPPRQPSTVPGFPRRRPSLRHRRSRRILTLPPAHSLHASVRRSVLAHASGDAPPPLLSPPPPHPQPRSGPSRVPAPSSPARCSRASPARGGGGGLGERHRPWTRPGGLAGIWQGSRGGAALAWPAPAGVRGGPRSRAQLA